MSSRASAPSSLRLLSGFAASLLSQTAAAAAPPPIVRVYVAGTAPAVAGARDAILDSCSRSNVAVVVRDAAGADEVLLGPEPAAGLAEAYIDLRAGTPVRVVVVDGESRQDLERRTLPESASLEVSIETAARVVCSAVESSLEARAAAPPQKLQATVVPSKPRATPAPASTNHARASRLEPRASLFAALEDFGAGIQPGAGAAAGATLGRSTVRLGLFVSALGVASGDVEAERASASFGLLALRLMPTVDWHVSDTLTPFVAAGGGVDFVRVNARRPPAGGTAVDTSTAHAPVASAMVGARLRLTRRLSALVALDSDVAVSRQRYVVGTPSRNRNFFEPSRVRVVAFSGLSWSFGDGGKAPANADEEAP